MNIHEYLSTKYRMSIPTTMTAVEAREFGIPYPLRAGWLVEHGSREVTPDAYLQINIALERRGLTKGKKKSKKKKGRVEVIKAKTSTVSSDDFLMSYEWRKLRMVVLKKFGARCQCCGATPADGVKMNVDHIKPRKKFPELALEESNLQVLCEVCNHGKGNWDQTDWR